MERKPSGLDMIRDITDRITEFLTKGDRGFEEWFVEENFEVIPIALTMEQIKKYNPPPNPAKITDPRAKKYIEEFGKVSWELDSLNALELRKIAEKSVLEYLNEKKYNVWVDKEKKEKQALIDFGISLSKKTKKEKNKR